MILSFSLNANIENHLTAYRRLLGYWKNEDKMYFLVKHKNSKEKININQHLKYY